VHLATDWELQQLKLREFPYIAPLDLNNLCSPPRRLDLREKPASSNNTSLFDKEGKAASSSITVSNIQRAMASNTHLRHHQRWPEHHNGELPLGIMPHCT
jgi:hypothetical protein